MIRHGRAVLLPYLLVVNSPAHGIHPRWILAAISAALCCVQIDYFATHLALPRMASDLGNFRTTRING